jgi:hypothetical protein
MVTGFAGVLVAVACLYESGQTVIGPQEKTVRAFGKKGYDVLH